MKKRKLNLISALIIVSLIFSTLIVKNSYGQKTEKQQSDKSCKNSNTCDKNGPFGFIPNLTDDQKSKIKDLHLNLKKDIVALKNQIGEKEAHLKTISMQDKVDINDINKTIDETFALKASLAKKKAAFHQNVRELLNNEQRVIFDSKASCGKKGNHKLNGDKKGCCKEIHKNGKGCGNNSK